jgi:antitoxin component of MazEF toxin-antitoxin module
MQAALHISTQVLPGQKIEIQVPDAAIGDTVDVFVILSEKQKPESKRRSVLDLIEQIRSKQQFRSAEDIDKQLQEERESWDN